MKILWIDLNSSYAHSSLALPALHAQIMTDPSIEWEIVSATIQSKSIAPRSLPGAGRSGISGRQ